MSYENPPLPQETVNVGREHVVLEFLRLAAGLALVVLVVGALLYMTGGWLARLIPWQTEQAWASERLLPGARGDVPADAHTQAVEHYLQALMLRLSSHMALPPDMQLRVHYLDIDLPNAFAGLGGHLGITRGLYQRLGSENELAMVMAHEIAHARARDPIAAIGGNASLVLPLVLLSGNSAQLSGAMGSLVQRGYSRRAERQADIAAIDALRSHYGHAGGAAAVFEMLAAQRGSFPQGPSLLSTHPLDAERIAQLRAAAAGWDAQAQPLLPLEVPAQASTH